jgi:dihydrofolate synthase/folylpolyglutamate synthase
VAEEKRSLADWLSHLEALHPKGQAGIELGLERVRVVSDALAQAPFCPVVMVAGTNGKGSTCAYLETIFDRAGYRVGCYSSPHLLYYNERVRLNTRPADDAALCRAFAKVEAARRQAGGVALTYFEFGTLAAWEVFAEAGVEVMILEVGLGGRLDAVNVYEPDVSIVTGIALDHTEWLGPTREHIGREKAGIFRSGRPAICADRQPPQSLLKVAAEVGADLRLIGRDFVAETIPEDRFQWRYTSHRDGETSRRTLAYPGLRGQVQIFNASAALQALDALRQRLPVSMQAIRTGLLEVDLPGRFQVLPGRPAVVLDVAHNPESCAVLADGLGNMGFFENTIAIVGMLGDKDMASSLRPLLGRIDHWLVIPLDSPRAAPPDDLARIIAGLAPDASIETCPDVREACERAAKRAGETDRIAVFGSFLTVAAVFPHLTLLRG